MYRPARKKGRLSVVAVCALVACIPSAGLAIGALDSGLSPVGRSAIAKFTPASVDPRMAQLVARNTGNARLMRFTPAGVPDRANRSMTVAVRVDEEAARAISVRSAIAAAQEQAAGVAAPALRLAPMRYNLGLARGYQSFAKVATAPALSRQLSDAAIPDLSAFRPTPGVKEEASRFVPRNTASEAPRAAAAPRAIEGREPTAEQAVDLAGSYRLTRNLDVTAGVRYSQDQERLAPLADAAKKDAQAVYIGTQFRF
jgi:hypothetical protein